jgi:N-acetylglucosamine kinase-like BadF-type ATPase
MSVIVAVDGGQSQCRIAVQAAGLPADCYTTAGLYYGDDSDGGLKTIARLLDDVGALIARDQPLPRIDTFVLALSGMPSGRAQRDRVGAEVAVRFRPCRQLITSDLPAAYAGAIGLAPGAVLSVGSGTIALGSDGHGQVHMTGGGGGLLGDDGSAYWIGLRGLRQAWRTHTGRVGSDGLLERASRQYGPVSELPSRLRGSQNPVSEVASFAPAVVDAAAVGDRAAARILSEAAADLADMLACVVTATFPAPGHAGRVSWSGRLLRLPVLHEMFAAAVRERLPSVDLQPPDGTALDGALRLGAAADLRLFGDQIDVIPGVSAI